MTEKEYRSKAGISRSELWMLKDSPQKFKWFKDHPAESSPAQIFGSAAHKMLLEPNGFDAEFAVAPVCDRRTKCGRETYDVFLNRAVGKDIISQQDFDIIEKMVSTAHDFSFVDKLLAGEHEKAFFWTDEMTGELCKIRADCVTPIRDKLVVVDYKTTADASTESFMRTAINYGYDFQAGMYCEGIEKATGKTPIFVFIAQEKTEPYAINIMQADDRMIRRGRDMYRELIGIYHECKETDNWYGYLGAYNMINTLGLPSWLAKEFE